MMDRVGSAALMVSYFRTLLVLLSVRPQPALLVSIPMLFSWLDANPYPDAHAVNVCPSHHHHHHLTAARVVQGFVQEAMSESKLRSYRIHLLCAAYLLGVSRVLTRLDSLRAAVELDEIASAAIERVGSRPPVFGASNNSPTGADGLQGFRAGAAGERR